MGVNTGKLLFQRFASPAGSVIACQRVPVQCLSTVLVVKLFLPSLIPVAQACGALTAFTPKGMLTLPRTAISELTRQPVVAAWAGSVAAVSASAVPDRTTATRRDDDLIMNSPINNLRPAKKVGVTIPNSL